MKGGPGSFTRRNMPSLAFSQIHGTVKMDVAEHIDRKQMRFMGEGAAYALSMEQAIADAGLTEDQVSNPRTGLIAGRANPRPPTC